MGTGPQALPHGRFSWRRIGTQCIDG